MPAITFDNDDILRSRIVKPDWYRVQVTRVGQKPASGNNPETKTIFPIEGRIIKNASTGDVEFAGVPTPPSWNFNDNPKARGFMVGFFESLGAKVEPGKPLELAAAEGRELEVFIRNDVYEGRMVNRINHEYRPCRD